MPINSNSLSSDTSVSFGSNELGDLWFQAKSLTLPGIDLSGPENNTRAGTRLKFAADTVEYSDLNLIVLLDNKWDTYNAIYEYFLENVNVDQGTFKSKTFTMWVDVHLGNGTPVKKFWFYDCRLSSIGDLDVDFSDPEDITLELNITFKFNYMDFDGLFDKKRLQ